VPPFRGEKRTDPGCEFLQFGTIDDAHTALRMLDGRVGPGGETLQVGLSRAPAVHPNRMWGGRIRSRILQIVVVVREKSVLRISGEGSGLGWVRKMDDQGVEKWDQAGLL
jgi:hypothetical protein